MKIIKLRQARVGDLLKETIAVLLQRKVKDPRVEGITITGADISVDLKNARIFFCLLDSSKKEDALEGLKSASGFLRREINKELRLRTIPNLYFSYDESFEYGSKIDEILETISKHENQDN